MQIDIQNPPKEVWHITKAQIRAGRAVQRLTPELWSFGIDHGLHVFTAKEKRGNFWSSDCFVSQNEANEFALKEARAQMREEAHKHEQVMGRLREAERAARKPSAEG